MQIQLHPLLENYLKSLCIPATVLQLLHDIYHFDHYYCNDTDKALPISSLVARFQTEGNVNLNAVCSPGIESFNAAQWNGFDEREKAEILKNLFKEIEIVEWGKVPNFDMIINATSVGLKKEDRINIDFPTSAKNKFFYDVIYNPKETNFLKTVKSLGNKTLNGKLMFIYQAISAFNIWHGLEPEINQDVIKFLDQ